MNKINYQKQLDKVIENLGETKPTLLLHSCSGIPLSVFRHHHRLLQPKHRFQGRIRKKSS